MKSASLYAISFLVVAEKSNFFFDKYSSIKLSFIGERLSLICLTFVSSISNAVILNC